MTKLSSIVVYTAGSFDMFHIGHLNLLEQSKMLGDMLIVGISTDELIYETKGTCPIITYRDRSDIVKHIEYVDSIIKQDKILSISTLKMIKPDIITIGTDWKYTTVQGLEWAKSNGIKVQYLPYTKGISTTQIKERIIKDSYNIIREQLRRENKKCDQSK